MNVKRKIDAKALKFVRDSLGLTQIEFAPLIGRKYSAIQKWENPDIPLKVQERIRQLAAKRGLEIPNFQAIDPPAQMRHTEHPGTSEASNSRWHHLLDEVLDSGLDDAISAVQQNLITFSNYAKSKGDTRLREKGA